MPKYLELQKMILERMDFAESISDSELQELIYEVLREYGKHTYVTIEERIQLNRELFNSFRKLDFLQELLEDDSVTEIMINGCEHIFIERQGKLERLNRRFDRVERLENIIQQIVSGNNRVVNETNPIVDTRLEDGSRVHVVMPPIAIDGPVVTIRKFPSENIGMKQLLEYKSINKEVIMFLEKMVKAKYNIFISGGTGSGKTTFLNALSDFIGEEERIITIEDTAELQLTKIPNLVRLETRNANVEGEGTITVRDLIKASLRMRPNRIIVGEVRGEEVTDMLMAMNTGHDGSLSTAHANSLSDMLSRLEIMMLTGVEIPLEALRRQMASAIDIMIHVGRLRDGSRKVLEVAEVLGVENGEIKLSTLYKFVEIGIEVEVLEGENYEEYTGEITGNWERVNKLVHQEKLLAAGYTREGVWESNIKRNNVD